MNKIFLIIVLILMCSYLNADFFHKHTITASTNFETNHIVGYKPEIQLEYISFDFNAIYDISSNIYSDSLKIEHKFYRAWLRYSSEQFDVRLGLQKINFGQAKVLRNLKWFDTINPLDPRRESKGVNAILFRYFFLNNANIWVWGIAGDNELKGNETIQSNKNIEPGFRCQIPIKNAEIGLSFHNRIRIDKRTENKFGCDFYLDYFLGMWSEFCLVKDTDTETYQLTFGSDYTLPFFSGLHILLESNSTWAENDSVQNNVIMLDLPVSLLDNISVMTLSNFDEKISNYTLSWNRNYDHLSLTANATITDLKNKIENEIELILTYDF